MQTAEIIRELNRIKAAEQAVSRRVKGPLLASDSVDQVYAQGLRQLGYTGPVYRGAGRQMFDLFSQQPRRPLGMAMDSKQQQAFAENLKRFPGASALKVR